MRRLLVAAGCILAFLGSANTAFAVGTLDAEQAEFSDLNSNCSGEDASNVHGQVITAHRTGMLDKVDLALFSYEQEVPVIVKIYSANSAGKPGATVLGSGSLAGSQIPKTLGFVSIPLSTPAPVVAGQKYTIAKTSPLDDGIIHTAWCGADSTLFHHDGFWIGTNVAVPNWQEKQGPQNTTRAYRTYIDGPPSLPGVDQELNDFGGGCTGVENGQARAQVFTAGKTGVLNRVDLGLWETQASDGPMPVQIRPVTLSGAPSETVLGSGTVDPDDVSPTTSFIQVGISPGVNVVAGTQYAIVLKYDGDDGFVWCGPVDGVYSGGDSWAEFGFSEGWVGPMADFAFKTFVGPPPDTTDPTVTLTTPPDEASYQQGAVVTADYSCADNDGGSGIATCIGEVADGAAIDTSTLGEHLFTVTATDNEGNDASVTHKYTVTAVPPVDNIPPAITLTAPLEGAHYSQGAVVNASYSCSDNDGGSGVKTCAGPVASGSPIDTATPGAKSFKVDAADNAGNTSTKTVNYTVDEGPPHVPAILSVDDDKVQCPAAGFTKIQDAVNAAGPGDEIRVCRGTYNETVTIGAGRDNVRVWSYTSPLAAVVKGNFTVTGGVQGVKLERFRIEPPPTAAGIRVGSGSSTALISQNLVVGGQEGIAVALAAGGTIRDNTLLAYTGTGISVSVAGPGTASADLTGNALTGTPASTGIAYDVAQGSGSGFVLGNSVIKNGATGIVLSRQADVTLKANTVTSNGTGVEIDARNIAVQNNKVNSNTGNGIRLSAGTLGVALTSNNANSNGGTDCTDLSTGTGTAGTANVWTANYGADWNVAGICKK